MQDAQHSTAQHSTAQHSTAQRSAAQHMPGLANARQGKIVHSNLTEVCIVQLRFPAVFQTADGHHASEHHA